MGGNRLADVRAQLAGHPARLSVDVLRGDGADRSADRRVGLLAYRAIGGGQVAASFTAATGSGDYLGYVTVGAAALTFTTRMVLWVAKAQITEYREGTLESQLLTPARRLPYLLGVTPRR